MMLKVFYEVYYVEERKLTPCYDDTLHSYPGVFQSIGGLC